VRAMWRVGKGDVACWERAYLSESETASVLIWRDERGIHYAQNGRGTASCGGLKRISTS
jgi:hypothetical protein